MGDRRTARKLVTLHQPIPIGLVKVILRTVKQGYRSALLEQGRAYTIWISKDDEPERVRVYNQDGEPDDIVPVTSTGRFLTELDIQRMAEESAHVDGRSDDYRTSLTPVEDLEYE